ncbi:PTS sugar transporter subunit IIA [Bifidobacterium aquikefiricola]|uniref:Fructose PTS transporter subunit IIA n=1 Tax=Bifidobacterium aquikefiricola TaxID=3059038 RepID=A0AB39U886_9BIFI
MGEISIREVLDRNIILTNLEAESKRDVIDSLTESLLKCKYIQSKDDFIRSVNEREAQGATGIGNSIAIPHGRSATVQRNGVAIAILRHEISWESLDSTGAKVVVLFAVGASGENSQEHLKLLSLFARQLAKESVTDRLLKATDVDQVIDAFLNE